MPAIRRMTEAFRRYADRVACDHPEQDYFDDRWRCLRCGHAFPESGQPLEGWTYLPHVANMAAPTVAELQAGTPIRGISHASFGTHGGGGTVDLVAHDPELRRLLRFQAAIEQPDILDRIDETLLTYDAQRATGEQPWPYGSF